MIKFENQNQQLTAYLNGEIDDHSARIMIDAIDTELIVYAPKVLKIDFKDVTFMDSSGIGLVIGRYRLMCKLMGEVVVTNATTSNKRIMEIAGLKRLVRFEE